VEVAPLGNDVAMTIANEGEHASVAEVALTERGLRTRAKLVDAAWSVFEEHGYLGTSVQDIADRAGVAYGTFYRYFGSREAIFAEVVDRLIERNRAVAAAEPRVARGDVRAAIERANRGYLRAYRSNARMMAVVEQVATFNPALAQVRRDARRFWTERSRRAIERWQAEGLVSLDIDAYYAASALGSMVDRSAYVWLVLGEPFDEERAVAQLTLLYANALGLGMPR
jgi:AcrR family transcriptional regulator